MVWYAATKYEIIRLYFIENENVTQHTYKRMLQYFALPRLRYYPKNTLYQRVGVPPHYGESVTQYLNIKFPNKWVGSGGPISWPLRYPDLSHSDYFVWNYLKEIMYQNCPNILEEFRSNITDAICGFDTSILENVYRNL